MRIIANIDPGAAVNRHPVAADSRIAPMPILTAHVASTPIPALAATASGTAFSWSLATTVLPTSRAAAAASVNVDKLPPGIACDSIRLENWPDSKMDISQLCPSTRI